MAPISPDQLSTSQKFLAFIQGVCILILIASIGFLIAFLLSEIIDRSTGIEFRNDNAKCILNMQFDFLHEPSETYYEKLVDYGLVNYFITKIFIRDTNNIDIGINITPKISQEIKAEISQTLKKDFLALSKNMRNSQDLFHHVMRLGLGRNVIKYNNKNDFNSHRRLDYRPYFNRISDVGRIIEYDLKGIENPKEIHKRFGDTALKFLKRRLTSDDENIEIFEERHVFSSKNQKIDFLTPLSELHKKIKEIIERNKSDEVSTDLTVNSQGIDSSDNSQQSNNELDNISPTLSSDLPANAQSNFVNQDELIDFSNDALPDASPSSSNVSNKADNSMIDSHKNSTELRKSSTLNKEGLLIDISESAQDIASPNNSQLNNDKSNTNPSASTLSNEKLLIDISENSQDIDFLDNSQQSNNEFNPSSFTKSTWVDGVVESFLNEDSSKQSSVKEGVLDTSKSQQNNKLDNTSPTVSGDLPVNTQYNAGNHGDLIDFSNDALPDARPYSSNISGASDKSIIDADDNPKNDPNKFDIRAQYSVDELSNILNSKNVTDKILLKNNKKATQPDTQLENAEFFSIPTEHEKGQ